MPAISSRADVVQEIFSRDEHDSAPPAKSAGVGYCHGAMGGAGAPTTIRLTFAVCVIPPLTAVIAKV